jgi:hypothetical protein
LLILLIQGPDENLNHPVIEETIVEFIYGEGGLATDFPDMFKERVPKESVALVATTV